MLYGYLWYDQPELWSTWLIRVYEIDSVMTVLNDTSEYDMIDKNEQTIYDLDE